FSRERENDPEPARSFSASTRFYPRSPASGRTTTVTVEDDGINSPFLSAFSRERENDLCTYASHRAHHVSIRVLPRAGERHNAQRFAQPVVVSIRVLPRAGERPLRQSDRNL